MTDNSVKLDQTREVDEGDKAATRRSCAGCGCGSGCLALLAVLSVVVGLLVVSAPAILRHYALRDISPDERKRLDELMRTPVNFPAEWQEVRPYSPELKDGLARLAMLFASAPGSMRTATHTTSMTEAHGSLMVGEPITDDEWTSIGELTKDLSPIIAETSSVIHLKDYAAESFAHSSMWSMSGTGYDLTQLYYLPQYIALAAHDEARAGNWDQAFGHVDTMYHMAQTDVAPGDDATQYRARVVAIASNNAAVLATSCTEAAPMRSLLQSIERLRPRLVHSTNIDPLVYNSVGQLRRFARDGFPSNLKPGSPGWFYATQSVQAEMFGYPDYMIQNLPMSDPRRAAFERNTARNPRVIGVFRVSTLLKAATTFAPEVAMRLMMQSNRGDSVGEQRTQVNLDLATLTLAARLYKLEHQDSPASSAQLVPAYIDNEPTEPFGGKPYAWDAASQRFYSIGPDTRDDHLATYSISHNQPGDIVLGDPRGRPDIYF